MWLGDSGRFSQGALGGTLATMELSWTKAHDQRNAWLFWGLFIVVIALLGSIPPHLRTVVPNYRDAALAWIHGQPLYSGRPSGFLYFPQSALAFIPFSLLPDRLSEALWRVFCLTFLAAALWQLALRVRHHTGHHPFLWLTLFTFPVIAGMARNGQMTTPLLATMILGGLALMDRRWTLAAAWLILGLALKPLMLVLVLLVIPLYPPMAWRLGTGVAFLLVFPFVTQMPGYVIGQYKACWHELTISAYPPGPNPYVDVFHLLAFLGMKLGDTARFIVSLAAGAVTLVVCYLSRRRHPHWLGETLVVTWSIVYLMLFNPRVEHNTYGMIAPVIALFAFLEWWSQGRAVVAWALAIGDLFLTVPSLGPLDAELWMRQTIALAFTGYLLSWLVRSLAPHPEGLDESTEAEAGVAAAPSSVSA